MSDLMESDVQRFSSRLSQIARTLAAHSKAIAGMGDDPFLQNEALCDANCTLRDLGLTNESAPDDLLTSLGDKCLKEAAEFWNDFTSYANDCGWEVHGSTTRRLVARGFFVELTRHSVVIEDVPGKFTPHVQSLVKVLRPAIETLDNSGAKNTEFALLLTRAYEQAGGKGEISLERVYRQAVMCLQSPQFWKSGDPKRFQQLTRPMFRARLSRLLGNDLPTPNGVTIRMGTTVDKREAWEIYSPSEGHVIQVGRLAIFAAGSDT